MPMTRTIPAVRNAPTKDPVAPTMLIFRFCHPKRAPVMPNQDRPTDQAAHLACQPYFLQLAQIWLPGVAVAHRRRQNGAQTVPKRCRGGASLLT